MCACVQDASVAEIARALLQAAIDADHKVNSNRALSWLKSSLLLQVDDITVVVSRVVLERAE